MATANMAQWKSIVTDLNNPLLFGRPRILQIRLPSSRTCP